MTKSHLLASFLLLVSTACTPAQRYDRLDSELDASMAQLDSILTDLFRTYCRQPGSIEQLQAGYCGDGTFRQLDSLCSQQHELLLRMADCCPRGLNRHLVSRVGQQSDLRHAAETAKESFGYRKARNSGTETR